MVLCARSPTVTDTVLSARGVGDAKAYRSSVEPSHRDPRSGQCNHALRLSYPARVFALLPIVLMCVPARETGH